MTANSAPVTAMNPVTRIDALCPSLPKKDVNGLTLPAQPLLLFIAHLWIRSGHLKHAKPTPPKRIAVARIAASGLTATTNHIAISPARQITCTGLLCSALRYPKADRVAAWPL